MIRKMPGRPDHLSGRKRWMWIFDSYYKGTVELWGRENGPIKVSLLFPNSFYMHLTDPPAYREMLAALESLYRVEECDFKTIFGPLEGYRIFAGRKVAEKIEIQTRLPSFTMWT
ncbi:hypothetical protein [Methanothrix sp.]|uniref:hypothetical protein n=1 Tax=Methanothrix sp. TaxID=90426 RepID=UPI0032981118